MDSGDDVGAEWRVLCTRGTFALPSILGHKNRTILAILNHDVALMPPIVSAQSNHCFSSIQLTVYVEMLFEEFQDVCHGGHLGYGNTKTLTILNLYKTPMPTIKVQLNPIYGLEDVV